MLLRTNVWCNNISSMFDCQVPGLKVNVTVAMFRKNFVMALESIFID